MEKKKGKSDPKACNYCYLQYLEDCCQETCEFIHHKRAVGFQDVYCLMNEIFGRLPVKQLAQWKIVSKEWNKMIKENLAHRCLSSVFVTTLEHPGRVAAIRFYCENECCIEKFEVPALRTLEFPISILGSCHDLVCIGDKGQNTILVINPSKKLYWQIEEEETEEIGDYGFGFDKVNDDYKIIKVYSVFIENYVETHAIVYSMKESGWRKINFPHLEICCDSCAGFLDPKVYWHEKSKDSLITFDLSIQDFDAIKLPEALQQDDDRSINFGVVRELPFAEGTEILLACSYEFENWGEKKFSELWKITKANQFEKMATLVHNDGVMWPLCYHHSLMIIVVLEAHRKIKLYNVVDNSKTHILCFGSLFDYPKIAAIGFLDNLLSPTNLPDDGSPLQGGCSVMKGFNFELQNSKIAKLPPKGLSVLVGWSVLLGIPWMFRGSDDDDRFGTVSGRMNLWINFCLLF